MRVFSNPNSNLILIKNKNNQLAILYNNNTYLTLIVNNAYTFISKEAGSIIILDDIQYNNINKILLKILNYYIYSWDFFFFSKIKIKGKSFKLKKKKNFVDFVLNTSHITWSISKLHILKRLKKTKLLYYYNNSNIFNNYIYKILNYRYLDLYTKRGLRLSRLKIFKKKGKTNMKI